MNDAKCQYCANSLVEYDPMKKQAILLCDKTKEAVEPNDGCKYFNRAPGSDDE